MDDTLTPDAAALPVLPHPGGDAVLPAPAAWDDPALPRLVLEDPATGLPRAVLPLARGAEVETAIRRARAAIGTGDPLAILARLTGAIEARREDFARAISQDMGSPIDFARSKQVDAACDHLRATLAAARDVPAATEIAPGGHEVAHEPLGVAALITPWNWPLNQVALKVGGALAAGCAMILKPSERSTGAALIFAECMAAAGAPPGLFTVLAGDGETGRLLAAHPGIDIVSFTGSTAVGQRIAAAAGANLVPALLELGGKSANLLFGDCDLPLAVKQGVAHCFRNSGQSCNAASRMLVTRDLYDRAVRLAAAEAAEWQMGPPDRPGPHLGPLVSQAQYDRVQAHIATALAEGARLVAGGPGRAPGLGAGWYPRPTVFADVTPAMRLFHEEVFGPVLAITPFDTEAEAVALANEGGYGLAGYVQTADPARQRRLAARLRVGMVQINGRSRAEGAPFGGVGRSGYGREAGIWGIRAFQSVKSVSGLDPL
ncbi:aldehyde dehydrogenase family protein [Mangrovicoccus algicola]|uniref:aldehyde dehydrogenase (NAD(+)) n=1 Tax=Mangrovicoccus algicola TaxID=2771008 RepID=A0A8J6ZDK4_9RHOB|nr:aldehyde dehydrogenase family protein [Mangrovicoccus algicola]MBE3640046.1 aldehyde dehydrogenase family protein [Mangrovicoccus algicola]